MTRQHIDMDTDEAWEEWGRRDPYFGVITDPRFRRSQIDEHTKREFFESGESHVHRVLATIQKYVVPGFVPKTVLEFGCGVGRLLVPFATIAERVVGLDVSASMLLEAQRNCDERQLDNVRLLLADDNLSSITETFDLIHSFIVFQHIPVLRGRTILGKLFRHIRPGGVGALHVTYSKAHFAPTGGIAPQATLPSRVKPQPTPPGADPEIQMNPYNFTEILFSLQCHGVQRTHIEFTDHGGELGVFYFFSVPGSEATSIAF
jgi:2-polyprenyl-3-methyl-5-hydroxy-6-metoxy-1,4-benzoquinol methylase